MNPFPKLWAAWGLSGLVIELAAFWSRRYGPPDRVDTLSRLLQWLMVERRSWLRRACLVGWFVFSVWFAHHLWSDR